LLPAEALFGGTIFIPMFFFIFLGGQSISPICFRASARTTKWERPSFLYAYMDSYGLSHNS
jgi:hypothetical protein